MDSDFVCKNESDIPQEVLEKYQKDILTNLGYVPLPGGGMTPPRTHNTVTASPNGSITVGDAVTGNGGSMINDILNEAAQRVPGWERLPGSVQKFILALTATTLKNLGGGITFDVERDVDDETGGSIEFRGMSNSRVHEHAKLDYNAEPIEIRIDTGIKANAYAPLYHKSIYGHSSPLHLSLCKTILPNNATLDLNTYIGDVMRFVFTNALQTNVSFSLDYTLLSKTNFLDMFNALINALQVYYYYDSVLMYCNNPLNRNEGMLALRSSITAADINDLYNLGRVLSGTPIPPNLFAYVFWMMQTYSSSNLPGSSLIKIVPMAFTYGGTNRPNGQAASGGIANVTSTLLSFEENFGMLSRACPNWVKGRMPGSTPSALHDPNFVTVWTNLPYKIWKKTANVDTYKFLGPSITNSSDTIRYNSYTNYLDGAAYAMTSVYQTSSSAWLPSLIQPIDNYSAYTDASNYTFSNRLSWYGTGPDFYDVYMNTQNTLSRDETYSVSSIWDTDGPISTHNFGSEVTLGVSADTILDTSLQVVDWMFSFDSMGDKAKSKFGYISKKGKSNSNMMLPKKISKGRGKSNPKK